MINHVNQNFVLACKEGRLLDVNILFDNHPGLDVTYNNHEAIRLAAQHGQTEVVAALLKTPGVDPTTIDQYALRAASENGHDAVVQLLLKCDRVDPSARNHRALSMACQNGHAKTVEHLLRSQRTSAVENNAYPLRLAIRYNHQELLQIFVELDDRARFYMQNNYPTILLDIYNTNAYFGYAMAERNIPLEITKRVSTFIRGYHVFESMKVGYEIFEKNNSLGIHFDGTISPTPSHPSFFGLSDPLSFKDTPESTSIQGETAPNKHSHKKRAAESSPKINTSKKALVDSDSGKRDRSEISRPDNREDVTEQQMIISSPGKFIFNQHSSEKRLKQDKAKSKEENMKYLKKKYSY